MFNSLVFYIAWRYTHAKRSHRFISFISLMSMLGTALGVMVLITVLSVFNGFDAKIQENIFSLVPQVTISGEDGKLRHWQTVLAHIKNPSIIGAAPVVSGQALMTVNGESHPVMLMGILPEIMDQVISLSPQVIQGKLQDLKPGSFQVILGSELADSLAVERGDTVSVILPTANVTPVGVLPRFKELRVAGMFHTGSGFGFDHAYAFIHLQDAQVLYILGDQVTGLELKLRDPFTAPTLAWQLQQQLGPTYVVSDWTDDFGPFYHAVKMEKTMMFLILLLLIAIAAFNLVSSLVMVVNEKRADIAILRTLGATPRMIRGVFMWQGAIIGLSGVILGVISGVILAYYLPEIYLWIQNVFHVNLLTPGVYFVNDLPSKVEFSDVLKVSLIAFIFSVVATIYPAWTASKVQVAEALRYE